MDRVVLTAQVEDAEKWEEGFRTHGDLFRSQTVKVVHFAVGANNEVALYLEMDDVSKYMEILESPATAEAMAYDGVNRDSVKVWVLDKVFDL